MINIYVLRHANWNLDKDELTSEGAAKAQGIAKTLPHFSTVIASPTKRAIETATLLTGTEPITDNRATTLEATPEQSKKIAELRVNNPFGAVGAIFSMPEMIPPLKVIGNSLVELIKELQAKYFGDENILIVPHDGTMVAAEKIMENENFDSAGKTFGEIEGFIVDGEMNIAQYSPRL